MFWLCNVFVESKIQRDWLSHAVTMTLLLEDSSTEGLMRSLLQNWIIQRPVFVYLAHHYHVSLYSHWLGEKTKTCGDGRTGSFCSCCCRQSDTKNIRIHADQQICELFSYSLHCEAIMQEWPLAFGWSALCVLQLLEQMYITLNLCI